MKKEDKIKQLKKSYKNIFKAINGLSNSEAITQLEMAKLDILLNEKLVIIDGKAGVLVKGEK